MLKELAAYQTFYKGKHEGHKLDWDHALGAATLRARFAAGEKELSVSLYQAVILLQFNDAEEQSFADLKKAVDTMGASSSASLFPRPCFLCSSALRTGHDP